MHEPERQASRRTERGTMALRCPHQHGLGEFPLDDRGAWGCCKPALILALAGGAALTVTACFPNQS